MSRGVVRLAVALVLAGAPAARANEPPADDPAALALRAATELGLGHYADAETTWRRVIALRDAGAAPTPELAAALDGLGEVLRRRGRFDDAEAVLARSLALKEKALGRESEGTIPSLTALGTVARSRGRYEEAEWLYRRALALQERAAVPRPVKVGGLLGNLADLYRAQDRTAEAEDLARRALALLEP